jgi:ribosomal protein S18 acetylase RimI-like enzyme
MITLKELQIRPYQHEEDKEKLVKMYLSFDPSDRTLGLPPATRSDLESWLDFFAPGLSIVAECNGDIVGHVAGAPIGEEVHMISFVHKNYRNMGLGQRMISTVIKKCRKAGYDRIVVVTDERNTRAIHVFRKLGFQVVSAGFEYEMHLPLY